MIYVLTGGPATGKGTRATILAKELGIPHIATGDMLREVALNNKEIREKLQRGELISDDIITNLLEKRIKEPDCNNGFVLDGYPRTYRQAELLDELLNKLNRKITKVMELVVPDELAFKRIETYKENAKSILDFYRKKGLLLTVDASTNPDSVVEDAKIK